MTSPALLSCLLLVSQLSLASGYIILAWGKCPKIPPMPNFDINRYMGKWYASESFDAPYQVFTHCISANYTLMPSGDVRVLNEGVRGFRIGNYMWDKTRSVADGFARVPDPSMPSALRVDFPGSDSGFFSSTGDKANYIVMDTDYNNYAEVWSCIELLGGFLRVDTAWILSRDRYTMPANTPQLKENLARYGVNPRFFKKIYQDIC